jgi:serine/threonine protein kinase
MTVTSAHLAGLSGEKRQALEAWLVEFDLSWDEDRLGSWLRRLPPRGDCLRLPALVEMVKIDLERRWQRGQRAKLEAYASALPELGTPERLPADLLLAEYEARLHCGATADLADFARRFPRQAEELRLLVGKAPNEVARAVGRASDETVRPTDHGTGGGGSSPPRRCARPVPPDLPTPAPGQLASGPGPLPSSVGRYRIVRELGRGAMGAVFLAHDTQLDRTVALKVPLFTAADGPEVRRRFHTEARAAATIEHPNVCPVYDVGEIDGTPYLTMAYLQGQPLAQVLERSAPLPARQAVVLVRQLTGALQAAHDRGVIHRDLKPSNIMINQRGEPVILDFGLARRLRQDDARLTQSGQPLGTPAYMSPEQVAGAVQVMGPGCDVYALGVILYQSLTGRLPFAGSIAEVLGQIVTQPPLPPSQYRPNLDARLEAICLKALSKKVADRYPSMHEFGAALTDYLRCDPAPTPRLRRTPLWLLLATGATAVILLACLLGTTRSRGTIQIELSDPRAEVDVQVDGEHIDSAGVNQPLRLRPGQHHLLVTGKKVEPVSASFSVARGDNPVLQVQLVPRADTAADPVPPSVTPRRRHDDDRKERKDDRKERKDDRYDD